MRNRTLTVFFKNFQKAKLDSSPLNLLWALHLAATLPKCCFTFSKHWWLFTSLCQLRSNMMPSRAWHFFQRLWSTDSEVDLYDKQIFRSRIFYFLECNGNLNWKSMSLLRRVLCRSCLRSGHVLCLHFR